ncbi:MAG: imelysin family protein [Ilumatobacteraceae bacterium]
MKRTLLGRAALTVGALSVLFAACGSSGQSRSDVVASITDEVVPQRYADAADDAAAVVPAVQTWCDAGGPDEALAAVETARGSWTELRPFSFGPTGDRRAMFIVDPQVRLDDVDALGDEGQPVDATSLQELAGADQRGWGAVEHLVTGELTDRRCAYALGAAELVAAEIDAIATDWIEYGPSLGADDEAANIALRNIVSESLFAARMVTDEPDPTLDEHRMDGIRLALIGTGEDGGITVLLSDDVVERLTAELDAGDALAVQITISTDIVGELGTTVNFSDADGDG